MSETKGSVTGGQPGNSSASSNNDASAAEGTPVQYPLDGCGEHPSGRPLSVVATEHLEPSVVPVVGAHPENDPLAQPKPSRSPERRFQAACNVGLGVFGNKRREYGNSIEWTGLLGAVVEIVAKTARLVQLVLRSGDHGRSNPKAVYDSLLDLHNYAAIGLMHYETQNWEGKELE